MTRLIDTTTVGIVPIQIVGAVVGVNVGELGEAVGEYVGAIDCCGVVGMRAGAVLGVLLGVLLGARVGAAVGLDVGTFIPTPPLMRALARCDNQGVPKLHHPFLKC